MTGTGLNADLAAAALRFENAGDGDEVVADGGSPEERNEAASRNARPTPGGLPPRL